MSLRSFARQHEARTKSVDSIGLQPPRVAAVLLLALLSAFMPPLLGGCQRTVDFRLALVADRASLEGAVSRILVELEDLDSGKQLERDGNFDLSQPVAFEALALKRGARLRVAVTGFSATSETPLAFGEQLVTLPDLAGEVPEARLFLGPVNRFAAHPNPSPILRHDPSVVTLPGGKLWIIGGADPNGVPLAVTESYDPSMLTFARGPDLTTARVAPGVGVTSLDGKEIIVVAGGVTQGSVSATAEVLDPQSFAKGPPAALSTARAEPTVLVLPDGRVLLCGGRSSDGTLLASCDVLTVAADLSISVTDSLVEGTPLGLPAPRAAGFALGSDGRHFIAGGRGSRNVEELDVLAGTIATISTLPTERPEAAAAATATGRLYVAGGGAEALDLWQFSPALLPGTPYRPPGALTRLQLLILPGEVALLSGGEAAGIPSRLNRFFEQATNGQSSADFLVPRAGHRLAITNTRTVLAIGGANEGVSVEILSWCERAQRGGASRCQL